ncbi:hypothetical protein FCH79_00975 [Pseudomonas koreensis]|uniref:hypothetical protein n=1 Tax=Pseudomonas koreensis TaxID=198620 RepID=UPI001575E5E1|nr:hypothetical protein [Pseudomonas koreensis]NTZ93897.1 hypothetical protein [Pseudomonas koreensis]
MENKPTQAQIDLLWHTLGLRPECRNSRHVYRNRFLAGPGHADMPDLEALVALGLMNHRKPPAFCDQSEILFYATEVGEKFAVDAMPPAPPPPKRTKFDEYLDECECYDGFAHFLGINMPQYQQRGDWGNYEYRMVRYPRGSAYRQYRRHYNLSRWSPYESLEVAGDWAPTMKEAKASYKAALKQYRAQPKHPANDFDRAYTA